MKYYVYVNNKYILRLVATTSSQNGSISDRIDRRLLHLLLLLCIRARCKRSANVALNVYLYFGSRARKKTLLRFHPVIQETHKTVLCFIFDQKYAHNGNKCSAFHILCIEKVIMLIIKCSMSFTVYSAKMKMFSGNIFFFCLIRISTFRRRKKNLLDVFTLNANNVCIGRY